MVGLYLELVGDGVTVVGDGSGKPPAKLRRGPGRRRDDDEARQGTAKTVARLARSGEARVDGKTRTEDYRAPAKLGRRRVGAVMHQNERGKIH